VSFKSRLIVHEGFPNTQTYITALQNGFFAEADEIYGEKRWVFVQHGASCHTTDYAIRELSRMCILRPSWPANSPDLCLRIEELYQMDI
jgi:hypothetical protein